MTITACTTCSAERGRANHGYGGWSRLNATHHRRICGESNCRYAQSEPHDYTGVSNGLYSSISVSQHSRGKLCNKTGCNNIGETQVQSHDGEGVGINYFSWRKQANEHSHHLYICVQLNCGYAKPGVETCTHSRNANCTTPLVPNWWRVGIGN